MMNPMISSFAVLESVVDDRRKINRILRQIKQKRKNKWKERRRNKKRSENKRLFRQFHERWNHKQKSEVFLLPAIHREWAVCTQWHYITRLAIKLILSSARWITKSHSTLVDFIVCFLNMHLINNDENRKQ